MVFSGIFFIFYFLPVMLAAYFMTPKSYRNITLFIGSLFFYAWGEPIYVLLMLFSSLFNYYAGLKIEKSEGRKRKTALILSIIVNLGILVFFKYTNFFIDIINSILPNKIHGFNIPLPIGISFYTFQTISYIVDVYRKKVNAQESFINFGTYVTLFPQLIAGPIVRYSTIEKQLKYRRETVEGFSKGLMYFTVGLSKKVLIANNIGLLWDSVSSYSLAELSTLSAWLGIIAFSLQIYFDFSGYSDMAIGLGKMFGFNFEKNFDYPYTSNSITEFWNRWHISLSSWFKEYVYIPLGGNRVKPVRANINIMIVWALTGLWHGASINFLLWGIYYAILLILEKKLFSKVLNKVHTGFGIFYTLFFVVLGWVFFATEDLSQCFGYIKAMFGMTEAGFITPMFLYDLTSNIVLLVVAIICTMPIFSKIGEKIIKNNPMKALIPVLITLVLCIAYLVDSSYNPFLYFRF